MLGCVHYVYIRGAEAFGGDLKFFRSKGGGQKILVIARKVPISSLSFKAANMEMIERTNSAIGDALVDGGTMEFERHKLFDGVTDEDIARTTLLKTSAKNIRARS